MPLLPFAEYAEVRIEKLRDYVLSEFHEEGKSKAFLFRLLLDFSPKDAEKLRDLILEAVLVSEAVERKEDRFGKRYSVDFDIKTPTRTIKIRTGWIIKIGFQHPTLTTCYIL